MDFSKLDSLIRKGDYNELNRSAPYKLHEILSELRLKISEVPAGADAVLNAPHGGIYFTDDEPTIITTQGTFVKAAGITAYSSMMRHEIDDNEVDNRLRYTGDKAIHFHIVAQTSINFVAGTNQIAAIQVYKYTEATGVGELIPHSLAVAIAPGQSVMQITTHADVHMDTDDYIEIHVANNTGTQDITVNEGYLFMMGMIPNIMVRILE